MTNSFDNFLPVELANQLEQVVGGLKWTHGWESNKSMAMGFAHWNHDLANAGRHNGLDIADCINGVVRNVWDFIQSTYLPDYILIRCYANAHTYGVEGYPHTDSMRDQDKTVVVYMNKDWRREWGGETLIYDGDKVELASVPAFNRGLIFEGKKWHCARGVTRICPDLRRTIMFKCAKVNADPRRDALQRFLGDIGASDKDHTDGSLQRHLLNTYDLLKAAGRDDVTCLAGGAHSVFGTNAFKNPCLDHSERQRLTQVIGDEATELAIMFGTINRPSVLEKAVGKCPDTLELTNGGIVAVTQSQVDALCAIEAANLRDLSVLKQFPNLKSLWTTISKN
jgi:hypothetical protein